MESSIYRIYAALASRRRLHILTRLYTHRCLPVRTIASMLRCSVPVVLYELSFLERSGLVVMSLPEVCITEEGAEIVRRVRSVDQDLINREDNFSRIVDLVTLRSFSVLLRLFYKVAIPIMLVSLLLSLLLVVSGGESIVGVIPLSMRQGALSTSLSLLVTLLVMMLIVYYATGKLSLVDVALSYTSLNALSLASVPLYVILCNALGLNAVTLLVAEVARLILPILAAAVVSNMLSYSSGKTFELLFLLISVLILIPSLTIYGLTVQLQSVP